MTNPIPSLPVQAGPGPAACDLEVATYDRFLEVAAAVLPEGYLQAMLAQPNTGYELIQSAARMAARVSLAANRTGCGSFIIYATVGAKATGTVTFRRAISGTAPTIKAGSIVKTASGLRFVTTADAPFPTINNLTVTAEIEAIDFGFEYNVPGLYTSPTGQTILGPIVEIERLDTDPAFGIPDCTVSHTDPTTGGVSAMLEGLGEDLGLPRVAGEAEDAYRLRIRSLPDTISPAAVIRNVTRFLAPYQLAFEFIELWDVRYQTCWDAPSASVGTPGYQAVPPTNPDFDTNLCAYDDERDTPPWRDFWLDEQDLRGSFVIVIERASMLQTSFAYDDPGMVPADFRPTSPPRQRGTPAFDVPSSGTDPDEIFPSAWDGIDVLFSQIALGLFQLLQSIKAAGVSATVERQRPFP